MWILFVLVVYVDGSTQRLQVAEKWPTEAVCQEKADELEKMAEEAPQVAAIGTKCVQEGTPI